MFRLLQVIFRHKFQDLLYILFYRFYVLQYVQQVLKFMLEDDS